METKLMLLGTLFLFLSLAGFYLAYLYGHKTKEFRLREYFAIIVIPLISTGLLAYFVSIKILGYFFVSALFGFAFEYLLGFVYHKTLNRRLWTYHRLNVGGYTSILSIPMWGVAGMVFWSLSQIVGI